MILQRIFNAPQTTQSELGPKYIQIPNYQAGVRIDYDSALQASAVYACIRVIAEDIAALPWNVFVRKADGSRERVNNSPAERVLNVRTNPEVSPFAFRETLIAWALTYGNGYAEIEKDFSNRVIAMYPISPDRVEVRRNKYTNEITYEISNAAGPKTYLSSDKVFHLHGIGFDSITGDSLVMRAARSIGLSISLEQFGAAFFGNGATLGGVIQVPADADISDTAKIALKETFNKTRRGPYNAYGTEILDSGMEYKIIGTEPESGQFTESRQFMVEEICRWFRVSPQKIAHLLRMTFNNVEQLSLDHVHDTLMPWVRRLEDEANYKLFGNRNTQQYTKINVNALLRGDTEARTKFYREMWNLGALSTNEIRELEDMNPVEYGEKRFVQLNMTTLEKAGEEIEQPAPGQAPDPAEKDVIEDRFLIRFIREDRRFNSLKTRYPRQEYIENCVNFLRGERPHLIRDLISMFEIKGIDATTAAGPAKNYAELLIEISRSRAINLYDNTETETLEMRAAVHARQFLDTVTSYKRLNYVTDESKQ